MQCELEVVVAARIARDRGSHRGSAGRLATTRSTSPTAAPRRGSGGRCSVTVTSRCPLADRGNHNLAGCRPGRHASGRLVSVLSPDSRRPATRLARFITQWVCQARHGFGVPRSQSSPSRSTSTRARPSLRRSQDESLALSDLIPYGRIAAHIAHITQLKETYMGTKDKASNQAQNLKGRSRRRPARSPATTSSGPKARPTKRRLRSRGPAKVSRTPLPTSKTPSRANRRCVWTGSRW